MYSNYIRGYNNIVSRMNQLNYSDNYMSALKRINNNSYDSNKLLNSVLKRKQNDYVNNLKEYSKYNKESKEFYKEFNEKFTDLKSLANKLRSYSSDSVFMKKYDTKDTEKTNAAESENKTIDSKKIAENQRAAIISTVEKFATSYNEAVTFLQNNSDKSEKIGDLEQSYVSIVKSNQNALGSIGLNVDASGKLTIDKDKLENAIKVNSNAVENALGDSTSGVASKIYNKTVVAMMKAKDLYPASKLQNDYINNTYFYNPNNSSVLQAYQLYSSGLFLSLLL